MGENAGMLFMGGASLGQAASSYISANAQATAIEAKGEYDKSIYDINRRLAIYAEKDALARGDRNALEYTKEVKRTVGAQRASLAGQGVDVDTGSAYEIQVSTLSQGRVGAMTIRNNAYREAWGYKVEALSSSFKGEIAGVTSKFQANDTLLTGGINALNSLAKGAYFIGTGGSKYKKDADPSYT